MKVSPAILGCVALVSAHGYEPGQARNNFAHESATCAAYFLLASTAPGLDEQTTAGLYQRYMGLVEMSLAFSSAELTKARVELATKTMKREMSENWTNFSIINNKYGYPCREVSDDPESRARYWRDKAD